MANEKKILFIAFTKMRCKNSNEKYACTFLFFFCWVQCDCNGEFINSVSFKADHSSRHRPCDSLTIACLKHHKVQTINIIAFIY